MSYAENKSLLEYGDLNSMHHRDVQMEKEAGEEQKRLDEMPAFLLVDQHLGGSYFIKWSKGDAEVPKECLGLFTGTSQANRAIETANFRMKQEAKQRALEAEAASQKEEAKPKAAPKKKAASKSEATK